MISSDFYEILLNIQYISKLEQISELLYTVFTKILKNETKLIKIKFELFFKRVKQSFYILLVYICLWFLPICLY